MNPSIISIVQQLEQYIQKAYQSGNKYDFIDPAYELCLELERLKEPFDAVEPILMLIEHSPDIDYGGPGPLGSFLESFYRKGYEEKLVESVTRKPTVYTIHLLERMINDPDDPNQSVYLSLLMSIVLDAGQPENIVEEAKENLVYLIENLHPSNEVAKAQLTIAQKLLETRINNYVQQQQALQGNPPPITSLSYQGISFKVINHQQAEALLPDITDLPGLGKLYNINDESRFPTYYKNGFFLLAEEDVEAEKLELDYGIAGMDTITILGFIFLKDLTIQTHILAFDTDNSPILCVLGNVTCPNIHLFGNIYYMGGKVTANLIWARYNHGELYLNGSLEAKVILADDMQVFIRKIEKVGALISIMGMNFYLKQAGADEWEQICSTHEIKDVFIPGVLGIDEYGDTIIAEEQALGQFKEGKQIIKSTIV